MQRPFGSELETSSQQMNAQAVAAAIPGSRAPGLQLPQEQALKEDLVQEVAEMVHARVEQSTLTAIEGMWKRGQKAMLSMQQQHLAQTQQLQGQLEAFQEAQKQLENENLYLRQSLEGLLKNLSANFGTPPYAGTPPPGSPQLLTPPPGTASANAAVAAATAAAQAAVNAAQAQVQAQLQSQATATAQRPSVATATDALSPPKLERPTSRVLQRNSSAPCKSQAKACAKLSTVTEETDGPEGQVETTTTSSTPEEHTFHLTLRRADNVMLGLDVQGDDTDTYLLVVGVRPGGAVEAWNRQCGFDSRAIRPADRITAINDAEDADTMRNQCVTKHLLKMTVRRKKTANSILPHGAHADIAAYPASWTGFSADADEFVPAKRASD